MFVGMVLSLCMVVWILSLISGGNRSPTPTEQFPNLVYVTPTNTSQILPTATTTPIPIVVTTPIPTTSTQQPPTELPDPPATATQIMAIVQVAKLNVRKGPGTDYQIITTAIQGEGLKVLGSVEDGKWLEVFTKIGLTGYVSADLVQVTMPGFSRTSSRRASWIGNKHARTTTYANQST